jgi:ribokinase
VLQVEALPRPGQTVTAGVISTHMGGKGANQAIAAARMGARTALVGATGDDEAGAWMRRYLSDCGVDIEHLESLPHHPSGRAYITLAASGENSIVVVGGANLALTADHVPDLSALNAHVFLSQLETPVAVVAGMFADPRAEAGVRILNAAPALPEGRVLFDLADILVVNETELMSYAGLAPAEGVTDRLAEAGASLIARPGQVVVVTLGAAGAAIVQCDGLRLIPGRPAPVIDTTGAGDCFCGVLAAELDRGAKLEAAVAFANAAAAVSVTRLGAAASAPTRAEVEAFLTRH